MFELSKTETETLELHIEFAKALETVWRKERAHSLGDYVRPTTGNGYEYECTAGGQGGAREPRWPTVLGNTVQDGSLEWTCRAFGSNASDTIASVNVAADTGLTISGETFNGTEVIFQVAGGTAATWYTVSIEVTTGQSEVLEEKLRVYAYAA